MTLPIPPRILLEQARPSEMGDDEIVRLLSEHFGTGTFVFDDDWDAWIVADLGNAGRRRKFRLYEVVPRAGVPIRLRIAVDEIH